VARLAEEIPGASLFDDPSRVRLVLKGGETVKDTR